MSPDPPAGSADQLRTSDRERLIAWLLAALSLGYLLPWAIAVHRNTRHRWWVLAVAGLLGWTVFGWFAALVMAIIGERIGSPPASGTLQDRAVAWVDTHPAGLALLAPLAALTAIVLVLALVTPSEEDTLATDATSSESPDDVQGAGTDTDADLLGDPGDSETDGTTAEPSPTGPAGNESGEEDGDPAPPTGSPRNGSGQEERSKAGSPASPAPDTTSRSPRNPNTSTRLVTRVIDGDTVELGNGRSVRVIGIDTPERGECHFKTASRRMRQMVEGKTVVLTRHGENTDRYDRLLRYIDIGTTDPGLRLIKEGLAIARYDSRDGYGHHPRQPRYVRADNATPQRTCAPVPKPQPEPEPEPEPANDCAPGYSPCVPSYPPDVNCADVNGPISVSGADPHGLDGDGDGTACE